MPEKTSNENDNTNSSLMRLKSRPLVVYILLVLFGWISHGLLMTEGQLVHYRELGITTVAVCKQEDSHANVLDENAEPLDFLQNITQQVLLRTKDEDIQKPQSVLNITQVPKIQVPGQPLGMFHFQLENQASYVCICKKCGSSSTFMTIYEMAFGYKWNYTGRPNVQEAHDPVRWKGVGSRQKIRAGSVRAAPSLAIIRDPRERILSAWKSKVTCHSAEYHTDLHDRRTHVPALLKQAGLPKQFAATTDPDRPDELCLSLTEFLQVLYIIHRQGQQMNLNGHYMPQHLGCFRHVAPSKWDVVTTVKDPHLKTILEQIILGKNTTSSAHGDEVIEQVHASGQSQRGMGLSPLDGPLLDAITRDEYKVLGPYL